MLETLKNQKGYKMINLKTNKDNKVVFENKDDIILWLKRMLKMQGLCEDECERADFSGKMVTVYTDHVIRNRYSEMIEWLESHEVA